MNSGSKTSARSEAPARSQVISPRLHLGKLVAPQQPKDSVVRRKLVDSLLENDKPVVVLVAPAGFGKTVLMSQLYEHMAAASHAVGWLSLDYRDNDFSRFMVYLREAVLRMGLFSWPPAQNAPDTLENVFSGLRAESFELIDLIASTLSPFTLFVDAFEAIDSPDVIGFMNDLVRALNPGQQIFIGSRAMRVLPMASLEVSGQLARIEPEALLFDLEESSAFIHKQTRLRLTEQDIALLQQKTEGWAAALRMFSLALPAVADARAWIGGLSGPTMSITSYLAENVLAGLPERLGRFVLETSVLDQLYGNLCDAVFEASDSAQLLQELHAANLFLSLRDSASGTYEFHSLFRGVLAAELKRSAPQKIAVLHRRAAVFLCSSVRYADALHHALQAEDEELCVDILELCVLRFVELGQLETVAKWLDAIDAASIAGKANIQRARAYSMLAVHRYREARDALENLQRIAAEQGRVLDSEASMQLVLLSEWMDRHDFTAADVERLLQQISAENYLPYGIACNVIAFLSIRQCDYASAQRSLDAAMAAYQQCGLGNWPSTYTTCFQGWLEMVFGNLRSAVQRFESSLTHASSAGQSVPSAFLADALYERGELGRAGSLAEEHLRLNLHVAPPDIVILSFRTAARASFLNGNLDRCELLLTELGDIGDLREIPRLKASAWLEKARLALLCGNAEAASRYHKLGTNPKIWDAHQGANYYTLELDDPAIASMRMDLVLGDPELAASRLELAVRQADGLGRRWRRIRLQSLLAQAYARLRRRKAALELLEEALLAAAQSGMLFVFADEPWYLSDLLAELRAGSSRVEKPYLDSVLDATNLVAQRMGELAAGKAQNSLLTLKETAILQLVADGKANKEIARILSITDNTVETHLRKINRKLETHSRTHALAKAREIGLLR